MNNNREVNVKLYKILYLWTIAGEVNDTLYKILDSWTITREVNWYMRKHWVENPLQVLSWNCWGSKGVYKCHVLALNNSSFWLYFYCITCIAWRFLGMFWYCVWAFTFIFNYRNWTFFVLLCIRHPFHYIKSYYITS